MKDQALTKSVKHLFSTIGAEDILKEQNGLWRFEDKDLGKAQQQILISEAVTFQQTKLWKILKKDIQWQANKRMFEDGRDLLDLTMAKSWLYVLDCIKTRLDSLTKGRGIFNTKNINNP